MDVNTLATDGEYGNLCEVMHENKRRSKFEMPAVSIRIAKEQRK